MGFCIQREKKMTFLTKKTKKYLHKSKKNSNFAVNFGVLYFCIKIKAF